MKQAGFFDVEERLARLSGLGDQLDADFFCGYRPLCKSFLTNIDV